MPEFKVTLKYQGETVLDRVYNLDISEIMKFVSRIDYDNLKIATITKTDEDELENKETI